MQTYIGCSGWSYKEWTNVFYPSNLKPKEYLSYYTHFFNTVEINNTYYTFPTEKVVHSWALQAPKDFKYSLKANKNITHTNRFKNVQEPLKRLYGMSDILGEKTGPFLFQFPPNFHFTFEMLEQLVTQLNNRYHNVVEFRHKSWWTSNVTQIFQRNNIGFCSVSGFSLPEDLIVLNKKAYVRFHGNPPYTSLYSHQALSSWIEKINSSLLEEVWVYFNNTKRAYAIQNALQLKVHLDKQGKN